MERSTLAFHRSIVNISEHYKMFIHFSEESYLILHVYLGYCSLSVDLYFWTNFLSESQIAKNVNRVS